MCGTLVKTERIAFLWAFNFIHFCDHILPNCAKMDVFCGISFHFLLLTHKITRLCWVPMIAILTVIYFQMYGFVKEGLQFFISVRCIQVLMCHLWGISMILSEKSWPGVLLPNVCNAKNSRETFKRINIMHWKNINRKICLWLWLIWLRNEMQFHCMITLL